MRPAAGTGAFVMLFHSPPNGLVPDCNTQVCAVAGQDKTTLVGCLVKSSGTLTSSFNVHPFEMAPESPAPLSIAYKLQVPVGSMFLKTDSEQTEFEFPAGAGGGKLKDNGRSLAVGLNVPD